MTNSEFQTQLETWLASGANQLLGMIPSGSGIFRAVDIPAERYKPSFVSTSEGSFKQIGESGNWFGTSWDVCLAETRPTGVPIFEVSRLTQETPVLNIYNLSDELKGAIYQDRDLPTGCFDKSHILLALAEQYLPGGSYSGVYFPSRRSDGGVLIFNPDQVLRDIAYTGVKPPPVELWQQAR